MKLKVTGVEKVTNGFRAINQAAIAGVRLGVRVAMEMVAAESQREVPRITGRLANSMVVAVTGGAFQNVRGTVSYATPYAGVVHEVPRPAGSNGKWKYLQDPWQRLEGEFETIIAEEVEHAMKGGA